MTTRSLILFVLPLLGCCTPTTKPVIVPVAAEIPTAEPDETDRLLAALSQGERVMLAQALIATHDWGSWHEHGKLASRVPHDKGGTRQVNQFIMGKLRLPPNASPALHELVKQQFQREGWEWTSVLPLISVVTDDYLPEHPEDMRAWHFLSFMVYLSDGEETYSQTVREHILAKALDRNPEGLRILHRNEHRQGCGQTGCTLCAGE